MVGSLAAESKVQSTDNTSVKCISIISTLSRGFYVETTHNQCITTPLFWISLPFTTSPSIQEIPRQALGSNVLERVRFSNNHRCTPYFTEKSPVFPVRRYKCGFTFNMLSACSTTTLTRTLVYSVYKNVSNFSFSSQTISSFSLLTPRLPQAQKDTETTAAAASTQHISTNLLCSALALPRPASRKGSLSLPKSKSHEIQLLDFEIERHGRSRPESWWTAGPAS